MNTISQPKTKYYTAPEVVSLFINTYKLTDSEKTVRTWIRRYFNPVKKQVYGRTVLLIPDYEIPAFLRQRKK